MVTPLTTSLRAAAVAALLAAGALLAAVPFGGTAVAAPDTAYTITGHGWGHGIGMSQYGAKGFAQAGYSATQIITYYFQGATVGAAPGAPAALNIELASGLSSTAIRVDAAGASLARSGSPTVPLQAGDVVTIGASGAAAAASVTRAGATTPALGAAAGTIVVDGPDGSLAALAHAVNGSRGHHYRGALIAVPNGRGTLDLGNRVGVEPYVQGVVPSEVSSSWPTASLQAQAIAARSYALATRKAGAAFDLWADTRSQMYLGIEHEAAATNAATAATAGQAAIYAGAVIPTFFSSTSGGRTAAIEDAWPGSAPRPYLTSVPDPYEVSPYETWGPLTYTAAQLAHKLGASVGAAQSVSATYNASLRAATVTITGANGAKTFTGAQVQSRLGLRSNYFRIGGPGASAGGTAAMPTGKGTIVKLRRRPHFGRPFVLKGRATAVPELWQRNGTHGSWVRAAKLRLRRGRWTLRARIPHGIGVRQYQLRIGGRKVAKLNVRPRVH